MVLQHALQAFLIAGVLAPFSFYAGAAARRLRLPQITGYLVSGVIAGPYALGILSAESVSDLNIIEGACLGIIGLAAGAELQLSELNRAKQQVVSLTAGICLCTWVLCYFAIRWSASLTPVLHINARQLTAVACLGATLMMARSPASAIAVLKELDARGPFVSLVMGVVVLKDVAVIVAFALTMELVPLIIDHNSAGLGLAHVLLPLLSVCVSLSAGLLGGALMSIALHNQLHHKLAALTARRSRSAGGASSSSTTTTTTTPTTTTSSSSSSSQSSAAYRCKQGIVLVLSTAVFSITRALEAEPLLACVAAGMLLANRRLPMSAGVAESSHEELAGLINSIMSVTNVAFFGLAGASLKLSAMAESVWVALLVFAARLVAIVAGSWVGCRAGAVKSEAHRQHFWMSMITQAGVAMGLARIAGTAFSEWGPAFQTVMMAIIMLNMLLGPPCFRAALIRIGEARAHALPGGHSSQLHRDAPARVPPLAPQGVPLAMAGAADGLHGRHAAAQLHTEARGGSDHDTSRHVRFVHLSQAAAAGKAAGALPDHSSSSGGGGADNGHHHVSGSKALLLQKTGLPGAAQLRRSSLE